MTAPTSHAFGQAWIHAYFAEVDRLDPEGLLRWYGEHPRFRFAGGAVLEGRAAIAESLSSFYTMMQSMRHEETGIWVDDAAASGVFEAVVRFVTRGGRAMIIPAVSVLRLKDGLVDDFRFVMDAGPLREPQP